MAKDRKKLQHIHSSVPDKQPTPTTLEVGEIAVNNAAGQEFLSIKSTDNKVKRFSSDEQMITYAKCTFDDFSVAELNEVLTFDGIRPSILQLANVIRQAISEKKVLINHTEYGGEKRLVYIGRDIIKEEKIEHGLRITLKTGEVIDLMDEIELFAWSNTK